MKHLIVITLLCLSFVGVAVDVKDLNPIETVEINVSEFKQPIKYHVTLPGGYDKNTEKKYFVLFDLHPRSQTFIAGMQDWLSHNGEWPWLKTIIINPADYHPEFAALFEALVKDPDDQRILEVIQDGILKEVDEKYRTNGYRIYSGFMGNGALGLYILLNKPEMFNAYLIASPTLANDFGRVVSEAPKKINVNHKRHKFLYMTMGDHPYESAHMDAFKTMEKAITGHAPKQLEWLSDHNESHHYMSRPIITLLQGIEALFDDIHNDLPYDSDISKQGVDAIVKHYKMLSDKKYGFQVSAEGSLKALAASMQEKAPERAVEIYLKTVKLYPDSAYAHSALAKSYAIQGQFQKAIDSQTVAVEKSKKMIEWHQNKHQQLLDEYKSKLTH